MAKGDVGSMNYMNRALGSIPNVNTAMDSNQMPGQAGMMNPGQGMSSPGMMGGGGVGPSFPDMLLKLAMQRQFNPPQFGGDRAIIRPSFGNRRTPGNLPKASEKGNMMSRMNSGPRDVMKTAGY